MENQIIERILPKDQAQAYLYILKRGPKKASELAKALGIARPIGYKILSALIEKKLVVRDKKSGKPTLYIPQHPLQLQEILEQKERDIETQKETYSSILPELTSQYHLQFGGIPGFRVFIGKRGIEEVYEDILNEGQDIQLIRSLKDWKHPETRSLVKPQMTEQAKLGIKVRSITPYHQYIPQNQEEWYKKYNIEQRIVAPEKLEIPAQIIIYAEKVAVTAFDESLITTIIEDKNVHETHAKIFEMLWDSSQKDDQKYRKIVTETHEPRE